MKNIFDKIKCYNKRKKQENLNIWLDRHYNVTAKNGALFIVNGDNPVAEISPSTTVYDVLEQLNSMKQSFKSYTNDSH